MLRSHACTPCNIFTALYDEAVLLLLPSACQAVHSLPTRTITAGASDARQPVGAHRVQLHNCAHQGHDVTQVVQHDECFEVRATCTDTHTPPTCRCLLWLPGCGQHGTRWYPLQPHTVMTQGQHPPGAPSCRLHPRVSPALPCTPLYSCAHVCTRTRTRSMHAYHGHCHCSHGLLTQPKTQKKKVRQQLNNFSILLHAAHVRVWLLAALRARLPAALVGAGWQRQEGAGAAGGGGGGGACSVWASGLAPQWPQLYIAPCIQQVCSSLFCHVPTRAAAAPPPPPRTGPRGAAE